MTEYADINAAAAAIKKFTDSVKATTADLKKAQDQMGKVTFSQNTYQNGIALGSASTVSEYIQTAFKVAAHKALSNPNPPLRLGVGDNVIQMAIEAYLTDADARYALAYQIVTPISADKDHMQKVVRFHAGIEVMVLDAHQCVEPLALTSGQVTARGTSRLKTFRRVLTGLPKAHHVTAKYENAVGQATGFHLKYSGGGPGSVPMAVKSTMHFILKVDDYHLAQMYNGDFAFDF